MSLIKSISGNEICDDSLRKTANPYNLITGSDTDTTQLFFVTALKLESGNKATDWSPAPEDICAMTDDGNGNVTIGIY